MRKELFDELVASVRQMKEIQAGQRKPFNGLALVVVRSNRGQQGTVHLRALSDGLRAGDTTIRIQ